MGDNGVEPGTYMQEREPSIKSLLALKALSERHPDMIAYGPLLSDDGAAWLGTAALLRAPDPATARAVLTPDRYAGIEVHGWQFGGRPS